MPQTVLITGASGGLGKAFVQEFAVRIAPKTLVSRVIKNGKAA